MSEQVKFEVCENCGGKIGKLETPNVWKNSVVCTACYKKLADDARPAPAARFCESCGDDITNIASPPTWNGMSICNACFDQFTDPSKPNPRPGVQPSPIPYAARSPRWGEIICPNPHCGYVGPPKKVARGSAALGCLLCLFFILPGVLYLIFMQGYRYVCPRCGMQIRSDT